MDKKVLKWTKIFKKTIEILANPLQINENP